MVPEGIQSEDLCEIHCGTEGKKTSGVATGNKLNEVYGSKYRIRLDYAIVADRNVFYPLALYK